MASHLDGTLMRGHVAMSAGRCSYWTLIELHVAMQFDVSSKWCVDTGGVCILLISFHELNQQIAIDDSFDVAVGGHISGIAPHDRVEDSDSQHFADPTDMSHEGLFCGDLEVTRCQ